MVFAYGCDCERWIVIVSRRDNISGQKCGVLYGCDCERWIVIVSRRDNISGQQCGVSIWL